MKTRQIINGHLAFCLVILISTIFDLPLASQNNQNRAIAGLSMGGMHTQTITNDNPGMFGYIGVFSMGFMSMGPQDQDPAKIEADRIAKLEVLQNSGQKIYWIACGKNDFVYISVMTMRETYDKIGFKHIYRESTGGHTWANWRI